MRGLILPLLVSTALAATVPQQQVFKDGGFISPSPEELPKSPSYEVWSKEIKKLKEAVDAARAGANELFDELVDLLPSVVPDMKVYSDPKPHIRREDSDWEFITRGADVANLLIESAEGEIEREVDGKLETYDLRTRKVNPKSLGVDNVKQYSGYLDDNDNDKHLFYWFFESRNDPKKDPVVLWLNGGPGCSSLTGLFMELGPSWVNKSVEPDYNKFSWNSNASVIFLDQPVNVGYSYSDSTVSDTVAAGKDVYALMTLFFKQFPEYAKQDFHIAGESYAGHYIPVFASEIFSHKKRNINLQSIMIGNGLTDGYTQYAYYRPMACGEGGYPAVLGPSECDAMDNALPRCQSLIKQCYDSKSAWVCVPASIYCNNALLAPYQKSGQNVYDIREPCEDTSNLCYPQLGWISDYLNKDKVMAAVGAEVSSYESCNFDINRNFLFAGDWMQPYHLLLPDILEKIPVLVYAGDADFICNHLGVAAMASAIEWTGQKDYNNAKLRKWSAGGEEAGVIKSSGNLTFLTVAQAGHMAPYNQPLASLKMLNHWLSGKNSKDL